MTFGFSRDDAGKFLPVYTSEDLEIWPADPVRDHRPGRRRPAGRVWPSSAGRTTRPDLKVGICGEHGGDPASVEFCHRTGLNYVSCSPYRVPIARLAAAQAAIEERGALELEK